MSVDQKAVGASRPRADAKVLVQGRGCYLDDVAIAGVLHIAFLRSPHAKARIKSVDVSEASSLEGVWRIVTGRDLEGICHPWETSQTYPGLLMRTQTALAQACVAYVGQPVVAAVAETRAIAEDALERVQVEWEPEEGACVLADAMTEGSNVAHSDLASNVAFVAHIGDDDNGLVFRNAPVLIEEQFTFHRLTGCSMETRGVIASYVPSDSSLTIYQSHTAPHQLRSLYAVHLGVDEGKIRVICPNVGGSFGVKIHLYPDEIATAAVSKLMGRPIKYVADRIESFVSDIHAREQIVSARLALDSSGRFLGWEAHSLLAMGPYSTHPGSSVQEGDEAIRLAMAPYEIPHASGSLDVVFQNKTIVGQYRGVGHPIASAVTEYMVDKAAAKLGVLPEVLRMLNYRPDNAYPATTRLGVKLDALSHQKCLSRLLQICDLPLIRAENAELRSRNVYRGIGLSTFIERTATNAPTSAHIRKATAQDGISLTIDPSGAIRCAITVTDQGQGTHAVISQIIADAMGVSVDHIRVVSGDSQATPYGSGVRASRGTAVGGELALKAGIELRGRVLDAAASLLQSKPEALDIADGIIRSIRGGSQTISLADLAEIIHFKPQLIPPGPQIVLSVSMHIGHDWPSLVPTNGIQASLVEVDVKTGFVKLLRHWAVDDFGVVINPLLVEEQVRGGIAQGIGQALFEELVYNEDGQLTNGTFADYCVPTAIDLPDIIVDHVQTPWPYTALGAKGAGEAGTTGAVGAVLNAVNDAIRPLNAKITEVPMTPERILNALGKI